MSSVQRPLLTADSTACRRYLIKSAAGWRSPTPENSKLPNEKLHVLSRPAHTFSIRQSFAVVPKCN